MLVECLKKNSIPSFIRKAENRNHGLSILDKTLLLNNYSKRHHHIPFD